MKTTPRYKLHTPPPEISDVKLCILDTKRDRLLKQPHGSSLWDPHHAEIACDFFNYAHEDNQHETVRL